MIDNYFQRGLIYDTMLPREIILPILENLYTTDFETFRKCIYVNSIWCQLAIPILWRDPWKKLEVMNTNSATNFIRTIVMFLNDNERLHLGVFAIFLDLKWVHRNERIPTLPYLRFIHILNLDLFGKYAKDWLLTVIPNYQENQQSPKSPERLLHYKLLSSLCGTFARYNTSPLDLHLDLYDPNGILCAMLFCEIESINHLNKLVLKASIRSSFDQLSWIKFLVELDLTLVASHCGIGTDSLCTFLQSTKGIRFLKITSLETETSRGVIFDDDWYPIIRTIRQSNLPTLKELQLGIIISGFSTMTELSMIPSNILSLEDCLFEEDVVSEVPNYLGRTTILSDKYIGYLTCREPLYKLSIE